MAIYNQPERRRTSTTDQVDALRLSPEYRHTVLHEPGEGRGDDDVVTMVYEPHITITYPPNHIPPALGRERVGFLIAQWDTATYLFNKNGGGNPKKRGGTAFPVMVPLPYSTQAGAPERAVAQHLEDAQLRPGDTKPANADKGVAGLEPQKPLHRLHHDNQRRSKNRSTAIATCVEHWGSDYATSDPAGPRECDEFPFASTYEGATQSQYDSTKPADNYSARPLAKADNGKVGITLSTFLDRNRIVEGFIGGTEVDAYYVKID